MNDSGSNEYKLNPNREAAYQPPQTKPMVTTEDESDWQQHRTIILAMHLCGLSLYVISILGLAITLGIWLAKKADHPVIERQGKEALNFQLTVVLASFLLILFAWMGLVGGPLVIVTSVLAGLLGVVLMIGHVVFSIIAAVKVSEGQEYQYPFCIRFF